MAGYVIADVNVHDSDKFSEYRNQVEPTVELYGGEYIVRGGEVEIVEGDWHLNRVVVIRFDSVAKAKEWYYSEEYKGPMALRHQSATTNVVFVEGV
tara:strand:- start:2238 stop:2525 length:288 start_codon:yes stop_codon:yes gene_type:complete